MSYFLHMFTTSTTVQDLCLVCSDDDYNLALTDGAFSKLIQVQLVRKIEGEQFFSVSSRPSRTASQELQATSTISCYLLLLLSSFRLYRHHVYQPSKLAGRSCIDIVLMFRL